jgi:hypothetical protein
MLNFPPSSAEASSPKFVSVQYGDGFQSFWLAPDATLAELAARIGEMDDEHDGGPMVVDVKVRIRADQNSA